MQRRITVKLGQGFSPQALQAQNGDAVFWENIDDKEPHQPVSTDANAKWSVAEVTPHNTSDLVALNTPSTVHYACKNHPTETGTIVVAQGIVIAPGANPLFGATQIKKGQCVSWSNSSPDAHQPCPKTGDPWFTSPIASEDISSTISFDTASATAIAYYCALHPDKPEETGTITVS